MRHPFSTALIDDDQEHTYAEVWRAALNVAEDLRADGVASGDVVALLAGNGRDFVAGYFGILAMGATVAPMPTMLRPAEMDHITNTANASRLLYDSAHARIAQACALGADRALQISFRADQEPQSTIVMTEAESAAVVFFTSGTMGRPKGAVLSHLNLVMNATVNAFDLNRYTPEDIVLAVLPLFHTYGQTVSMNATFRAGATMLTQARFSEMETLRLMIDNGVTVFSGVPTMYIRILEAAKQVDDRPPLRLATAGGAALPVAVLEQFERAFSVPILEGYGLSETSPTATVNQPEFGLRAGSVGHAIWGVDVEIANSTVEERIELVEAGEHGEVVVRGHNVFSEYVGDPEATGAVVQEGWFRTGDIGVKDADGFIFIVDRKKDLIIRGGYNVYPREIEEELARHPAVLHVAVIGIDDPILGEEVCAVVVPKSGSSIDPHDLQSWSKERLGGQKYPRRIVVQEEMPMGPSQKILKRELRKTLKTARPCC